MRRMGSLVVLTFPPSGSIPSSLSVCEFRAWGSGMRFKFRAQGLGPGFRVQGRLEGLEVRRYVRRLRSLLLIKGPSMSMT